MAARIQTAAPSLLICALGISLITAGCRRSDTTPHREAQAGLTPPVVSAEACPYGHPHVRRAKVLYGLLAPDAELQREIDAGAVVAAGCVVFDDSPDYLLVCKTCGFDFNPVTEEWERESPDPLSFERPLSPTVLSFPLPDPATREGLQYNQHFQDGELTSEGVQYWSNEPKDALYKRIAAYVQAHEGRANNETAGADRVFQSYELSIAGVPAELCVSYNPDGQPAHVSLDSPPAPLPEARNPAAAVKLEDEDADGASVGR